MTNELERALTRSDALNNAIACRLAEAKLDRDLAVFVAEIEILEELAAEADKALLEYMGGKKSTLSDSANRLIGANLVRRANGRYYAKVPAEPQNRDATPKTGGSERFGGFGRTRRI